MNIGYFYGDISLKSVIGPLNHLKTNMDSVAQLQNLALYTIKFHLEYLIHLKNTLTDPISHSIHMH